MARPLKKVCRDASLHEESVKKVAAHKPVRRRRQADKKVHEVTTMRMDMRVWRAALEIAGNDRYRIQVISESEVIVWNNHKWRNNPTNTAE